MGQNISEKSLTNYLVYPIWIVWCCEIVHSSQSSLQYMTFAWFYELRNNFNALVAVFYQEHSFKSSFQPNSNHIPHMDCTSTHQNIVFNSNPLEHKHPHFALTVIGV